jgi:hypothetical protein
LLPDKSNDKWFHGKHAFYDHPDNRFLVFLQLSPVTSHLLIYIQHN